jgi:hypothetical protein
VYNTRTGIEEIGWEGLEIVSATHDNKPYGSIKCG